MSPDDKNDETIKKEEEKKTAENKNIEPEKKDITPPKSFKTDKTVNFSIDIIVDDDKKKDD